MVPASCRFHYPVSYTHLFSDGFPYRSAGLSCSALTPDDAPAQLDFLGDEAVSYTHLDVYKRQTQPKAHGSRRERSEAVRRSDSPGNAGEVRRIKLMFWVTPHENELILSLIHISRQTPAGCRPNPHSGRGFPAPEA